MAVRPPVATVNDGSAPTVRATAYSSSPTSQSRLVGIKCRPRRLFLMRQRAHDITAGLLVPLEREHAAPLGFLEQSVERAESIIRLGEAGFAPLQRLLDHRPPDLFFRPALGEQRLYRRGDELDCLLASIFVAFFCRR